MSGPSLVKTIGEWRLERFAYDGAPLIATRPADRTRSEITAEIASDGALDIDADDDVRIPASVLAELLADFTARSGGAK